MRDVRQSSRSVVSLDRAQLVGLGFFAVLSGGLMFGLGYSAGKVPRPEPARGEPPVLSQIDAEHALHQKMKQDPVDYTFFKSLVAKDEARPKPAPVVVVDKPVEKPVEKTIEKSIEKVAEKAVELKLPPELQEPKEPTLASALAPTSAPEPAPAPAPAEIKKPAPAKPVVSKVGEFTIQVSAFRIESDADSFVNKLQSKGFQAFITPSEVAGKGTWYRVRVGHFPSDAAAGLYKQKLERENFPAWVVKAD